MQRKLIKIGWAIIWFNASSVVANSWFGIISCSESDFFMAGVSFAIALVNLVIIIINWKIITQYKQELKDQTWNILKSPSNGL